jgi:hypothetical protein
MKVVLMMLCAVITLSSLAFATEVAPLNEEYIIWADITQNGQFFSATNATLTLITPEKTIALNSTEMINYATGIYYYNFTFNQTGEWFGFVEFSNATDVVAIASQTLIVRESQTNMELAIVIGLIALAIWLIYVGRELMSKPVGQIQKKIDLFLQPRNFGVFLHLAASWVFVGLLGFLSISSVAKAYESLITSIFTTFIWLVAFFNLGYLVFYILFTITEWLNAKNYRLRGGR